MYKPVDHLERSCNWCKTTFKPKTKHQNFCSKTCYKRHGKKFKGHSNGIQENRNLKARPYIKHKKIKCECCGFIPKHLCQLDVHHVDGNHENNDPTNLQTLCANCHRLETAKQLGWFK